MIPMYSSSTNFEQIIDSPDGSVMLVQINLKTTKE